MDSVGPTLRGYLEGLEDGRREMRTELEQARARIAELEAARCEVSRLIAENVQQALDRAAEEASEHHCGVGFKPNFCDCKYEIAAAIRKLKEPSDGG